MTGGTPLRANLMAVSYTHLGMMASGTPKKIRVLIVDDSASVCQALAEVLNSDPDIQVIGTASDPYVAVEHIKREIPDVITLDVEMPRMDGLTFLRKIMSQHPIPCLLYTSPSR